MPYLGSTPTLVALERNNIADDAITSAKIADDAVTLAKLAAGTDGDIITFDSSGDPALLSTGTSGQLLTSGGAGVAPSYTTISSGYTITDEQATASGSGITFSGIPSGVKRVIMMVEGTSSAGAGDIYIQLGDGGGLESSGYLASGAYVLQVDTTGVTRSTSSFLWRMEGDRAWTYNGAMNFFLKDVTNNTWVARQDGDHGGGSNRQATLGGGTKSLSAVLTQIKIFPQNDAFDAGSISVMYA